MKLTDQQKQGIRNLYGDDSTGATSAIEKVESKKGKFRFFNEDGSVNVSKEDFEKKINKESKPSVKVSSDEAVESIVVKIDEAKAEIKKLKDLKGYNTIKGALKSAYGALNGRRNALRDEEIARLKEEIAEREERIKELTTEKVEEKAGEPRTDIKVEVLEEKK